MKKKRSAITRYYTYMAEHFKYIADGCRTLDEVIECLKEEIKYLKRLQKENIKIEPVDNGHLFIKIPKSKLDKVSKILGVKKEDILEYNEIE